MIDADKVISVAERAIYIGAGSEQLFTANEIQVLASMLREAERDAARYRFMQDMSDEVDVSRFFYIDVSERDAEIDQAMKEKGDE